MQVRNYSKWRQRLGSYLHVSVRRDAVRATEIPQGESVKCFQDRHHEKTQKRVVLNTKGGKCV